MHEAPSVCWVLEHTKEQKAILAITTATRGLETHTGGGSHHATPQTGPGLGQLTPTADPVQSDVPLLSPCSLTRFGGSVWRAVGPPSCPTTSLEGSSPRATRHNPDLLGPGTGQPDSQAA